MNAGTSLRADARTPARPASASRGEVGWGTAKRLALVPVMLNHFSGVMAGLVPAIHVLLAEAPKKEVDAREDGVPAA
jgi:hypothetical protein